MWGGGGLTNERPGSDHVILGPMRGLEKNRMGRGQTNTQFRDRQTLRLLERIGLRADSLKILQDAFFI